MDKFCNEHSGFEEAIKSLKKDKDAQWTEINMLKNRFLVLITGVALTFLGVIGNIVILLLKSAGAH